MSNSGVWSLQNQQPGRKYGCKEGRVRTSWNPEAWSGTYEDELKQVLILRDIGVLHLGAKYLRAQESEKLKDNPGECRAAALLATTPCHWGKPVRQDNVWELQNGCCFIPALQVLQRNLSVAHLNQKPIQNRIVGNQFSIDRVMYYRCFHILAIVNNSTVNVGVLISF